MARAPCSRLRRQRQLGRIALPREFPIADMSLIQNYEAMVGSQPHEGTYLSKATGERGRDASKKARAYLPGPSCGCNALSEATGASPGRHPIEFHCGGIKVIPGVAGGGP